MYFSGVSEHPCEQLASPVLMLSIKNDLDWVFVYFFHKSSFLCGIQGKDYASLSGGLLVQGHRFWGRPDLRHVLLCRVNPKSLGNPGLCRSWLLDLHIASCPHRSPKYWFCLPKLPNCSCAIPHVQSRDAGRLELYSDTAALEHTSKYGGK